MGVVQMDVRRCLLAKPRLTVYFKNAANISVDIYSQNVHHFKFPMIHEAVFIGSKHSSMRQKQMNVFKDLYPIKGSFSQQNSFDNCMLTINYPSHGQTNLPFYKKVHS